MSAIAHNLWPGDFERLLIALEPKLRIWPGYGGQEGRAGLYFWQRRFNPDGLMEHRSQGHWLYLGGVAVNWIPEWTIKDHVGRTLRPGWKSLLHRLTSIGYVRPSRKLVGPEFTRRPVKMRRVLPNGYCVHEIDFEEWKANQESRRMPVHMGIA